MIVERSLPLEITTVGVIPYLFKTRFLERFDYGRQQSGSFVHTRHGDRTLFCPYEFPSAVTSIIGYDDDAMDMIWHYDEFIQLHILVVRWNFQPMFLYKFSVIIQSWLSLMDFTEHLSVIPYANCHEIRSGLGIIESPHSISFAFSDDFKRLCSSHTEVFQT